MPNNSPRRTPDANARRQMPPSRSAEATSRNRRTSAPVHAVRATESSRDGGSTARIGLGPRRRRLLRDGSSTQSGLRCGSSTSEHSRIPPSETSRLGSRTIRSKADHIVGVSDGGGDEIANPRAIHKSEHARRPPTRATRPSTFVGGREGMSMFSSIPREATAPPAWVPSFAKLRDRARRRHDL